MARLLDGIEDSQSGALNEHQSKLLLKAYGVPVVDEAIVTSVPDAVDAAGAFGFPVVLKGLGRTLLHKTERRLVHLNLATPESVEIAARSVMEEAGAALEGFLIQPQVTGRRELVAGLFKDPLFGPVIMFGIGGVFAEALKDVTFRLAPLTQVDIDSMTGEIRAKEILGNFRGEAAVNRRQLARTLLALSRIAVDRPNVSEIDINPLIVTETGEIRAVDALVAFGGIPGVRKTLPPVDPHLLGKFFHPRSIVFVGASSQFGKWGHNLLSTTIARGFGGDIHLVNPKGGRIAGREVHPSVRDIPGPVDLAVVTIPAAGVMPLISELKKKGITNMLLITSGFSETGAEGRRAEEALMAAARASGILVIGPNTMGITNPHIRLYCTGSHVGPEPGDTAVVAQSGNMGTQLLAFAENQGIGIRCFSGSGNEAMVTVEDYLDAFEVDALTRNVVLYIESVKDGRRFFESTRRIGRKKPIILMKGGRTEAGGRAAASHTGALSSDNRIFEAVCRQAGIVTADYPMDLLDLAAAFSSLPLPRGSRAAIMTFGGGWGVVTADLCAEFGLEVPPLSDGIIRKFDAILPDYWSRSNPVDIVGEYDPNVAMTVLTELMKWDGCDAVINLGLIGRSALLGRIVDSVKLADPSYDRAFLDTLLQGIIEFEKKYVQYISELMGACSKPVFGVSFAFDQEERTVYPVAGQIYKSVVYPTPEKAVKSLAKMVRYREFLTMNGDDADIGAR
ncbi:acetate--CoA ligase family protein [Desulfococcus sp.]|uniref:acetate--CoA ligase family protein n=1 Tax=Desulfococcus sp. TaxID=2025834 RepID=UPI00359334BF